MSFIPWYYVYSPLQSYSAKAKNREHAKNTRIRKKHYIEALKESLKLLFDERDKIDKDRRSSLSRLAEQANVRKQVLQTMFFYRASAETSLKRWGSILDDNFQLVLPITPYRSFPPAEVIFVTSTIVFFLHNTTASSTLPDLHSSSWKQSILYRIAMSTPPTTPPFCFLLNLPTRSLYQKHFLIINILPPFRLWLVSVEWMEWRLWLWIRPPSQWWCRA